MESMRSDSTETSEREHMLSSCFLTATTLHHGERSNTYDHIRRCTLTHGSSAQPVLQSQTWNLNPNVRHDMHSLSSPKLCCMPDGEGSRYGRRNGNGEQYKAIAEARKLTL